MARSGNYLKGDFFPGERKVTRRMSEYKPENLYWKYVYTLFGGNKGRIEKVSKKEAVLWNGERIKRVAWPLYIILDEEYRAGETAMAASDIPDAHISKGSSYKVLGEFGKYHMLKVECDDGEIREIHADYFEKIRSERDLSWMTWATRGK